MSQCGQKVVAGALLVLAGAVLFSAGVIADSFRPIVHSQREHDSVAVILSLFAGMAIGVIGFLLVAWGVAEGRTTHTNEESEADPQV
jgi:uncharacterized membrane protein